MGVAGAAPKLLQIITSIFFALSMGKEGDNDSNCSDAELMYSSYFPIPLHSDWWIEG